MQKWNLFKPSDALFVSRDDKYLQDLLASKGADDSLLDRHVKYVLLKERWRIAIEPWRQHLRIFKLLKEIIRGRYRKSAATLHSGANSTSGGSGTGATANVTVQGGAITGISITSAGAGYTGPPTPSPPHPQEEPSKTPELEPAK
jgi:hypothetical protein